MDIPWQLCRTIGPLLRDSPWQVLKHSQGGDFLKCSKVGIISNLQNNSSLNTNLSCICFGIAESPCQLHCKPKKKYFSVMLKDMVTDGTPCKMARNDMCISGRCRVSIFDIVGSNYIMACQSGWHCPL